MFLDTLLATCLVLAEFGGGNAQGLPERRGELNSIPGLSSPEDCARTCHAHEPPRTCYYHFTLELYTTLGYPCQLCTSNNTNALYENCQCVSADGVERSILTANRMVPGPSIQVCMGDKVVIDVENRMEGMETSIHWHGIWQKGYQYYDGVPFVTQCPISQGNTFRYQWVAKNSGTHFWHSHDGLQKMDGLYGSIVVREPLCKDPNSYLYDEDSPYHVLLLSDWMHEPATERFPGTLNVNPGQTPESLLINGKGKFRNPRDNTTTNTTLEVFTIKSGRRYRIRMINAMCTVCPGQLDIEGHTMTLIATDGEPVRPKKVNTIVSFAGERYDFVINGDQPPGAYWIQYRALGECGVERVQQLGILRYENGPEKPSSTPPTYDNGLPQGVVLNPLDAICDAPRKDAVCVSQLQHAKPVDRGILAPKPAVKIFLPFSFLLYTPEQLFQPRTYETFLVAPDASLVAILIDGISYVAAPSPPLSQLDDLPPDQFCNGDKRPEGCGNKCFCTQRFDIPLNSIVEVIIVDDQPATNLSHPFHLHGYAFNVIGMGRSPDKNVTKMTLEHARDLDRRGLLRRNWDMVPFKDTIAVPNNGYAILRFRADNPGEWLFHCHFIYHILIGMDVIFHVGEPGDLPPVPKGFPKCGNFLPEITLAGNELNR